MTRKSLPALIALNVVLLLALVVVTLAPAPAGAQGFASARYLMLAGPATGRTQQDIIYIIEMNTTRVVAAIYNSSDNTWKLIDGASMIGALRSTRR